MCDRIACATFCFLLILSAASVLTALEAPKSTLPEAHFAFEPTWFTGSAEAKVVPKVGLPLTGIVTFKDGLLQVEGNMSMRFKPDELISIAWSGIESYKQADELYELGLYEAAARIYQQRSSSGSGSQKGKWYGEGRFKECQARAEHLTFCTQVFNTATPEYLQQAAQAFLKLTRPGNIHKAQKDRLVQLLAEGKVSFSPEELKLWQRLHPSGSPEPSTKPTESTDKVTELASKPDHVVPENKARNTALAATGFAPAVPKPQPQNPSAAGSPSQPGAKNHVPTAATVSDGEQWKPDGPVPDLNPTILALTWVGGSGDQFIREVGFNADGTIFGRGGGGGFTVIYGLDGNFKSVTGDINKPSTGGMDEPIGMKIDDPYTGGTLEIKMRQVASTEQQPWLVSSHGWRWWCEGRSTEYIGGDHRGYTVMAMPNGRFVAKTWCDGWSLTQRNDPRNYLLPHPVREGRDGQRALGISTSGSCYQVGDSRTGKPLGATGLGFRPNGLAHDKYGRIYIGECGADDKLGLGGNRRSGLTIFDDLLRKVLWSGQFGGDKTCGIAVKDNLCVIGGVITGGEQLKVKNPAQAKPGGGTDGLFCILKLW